MTWNSSIIQGPWPVPVYGAPVTDPNTGQAYRPVTGDTGQYCLIVPANFVTAALRPYAQPVPDGVPVIAGVASLALCFANEAEARGHVDLAGEWLDLSGKT